MAPTKPRLKSPPLFKLYLGTVVRLALGLLLVLFGVASYLVFYPFLLQTLIESKIVVLRPGGSFYKSWSSANRPMFEHIYLFELLNGREFLRGQKPRLAEHGPFVFSVSRRKENISWLDKGRKLSYYERYMFHFDRSRSVAGLEDFNLTVINLSFASMINKAHAFDGMGFIANLVKPLANNLVRQLMTNYGERLLERRTPGQIIAGRPVELFDALKSVMEPLSILLSPIKDQLKNIPKQVGYLYQRNNTPIGPIVVHTGRRRNERATEDLVRELDSYLSSRNGDSFVMDFLYWLNGLDRDGDGDAGTNAASGTITAQRTPSKVPTISRDQRRERRRQEREERRRQRDEERRRRSSAYSEQRSAKVVIQNNQQFRLYDPINRPVTEFYAYQGKRYLNNYDKPGCNRPFGSDGTAFDNFRVRARENLYVYTSICRTLKLTYQKNVYLWQFLPLHRYTIDPDAFSMRDRANWCYCKDFDQVAMGRRFPRNTSANKTSAKLVDPESGSSNPNPCDQKPSTAETRRNCRQYLTDQYVAKRQKAKPIQAAALGTNSSASKPITTLRPRSSLASATPRPTPRPTRPPEIRPNIPRDPGSLSSSPSSSGSPPVQRPIKCDGYHDMDVCAQGAPVAITFPHFLHSPALLGLVDGLRPSEDRHGTTMDLEPTTGMTLGATVRLQINIKLTRNFYQSTRDHFRPLLMPYLWIQEGGKAEGANKRKICWAIIALNSGYYLCVGLSALGVILIWTVFNRFIRLFNNNNDKGSTLKTEKWSHTTSNPGTGRKIQPPEISKATEKLKAKFGGIFNRGKETKAEIGTIRRRRSIPTISTIPTISNGPQTVPWNCRLEQPMMNRRRRTSSSDLLTTSSQEWEPNNNSRTQSILTKSMEIGQQLRNTRLNSAIHQLGNSSGGRCLTFHHHNLNGIRFNSIDGGDEDIGTLPGSSGSSQNMAPSGGGGGNQQNPIIGDQRIRYPKRSFGITPLE